MSKHEPVKTLQVAPEKKLEPAKPAPSSPPSPLPPPLPTIVSDEDDEDEMFERELLAQYASFVTGTPFAKTTFRN